MFYPWPGHENEQCFRAIETLLENNKGSKFTTRALAAHVGFSVWRTGGVLRFMESSYNVKYAGMNAYDEQLWEYLNEDFASWPHPGS